MSSYKGLTTKELTTRLIAAEKENASLKNTCEHYKELATELNNATKTLHSERNLFKGSAEEANTTIANLRTQLANEASNLKQALDQRDNFIKEFEAGHKRANALIRDLDYERKRRISAENKAFELETRLHNTVASEYPASNVPSYMVGVRIDRNGEIA
ncbi:MAG: hypothetical protein IPP74_13155 [Alphaproteobacteria bacterium]|nr:hypothetical protein [Alphaproteobacteria bacterium]